MTTLIEVDMSTIREVAKHFKKCQEEGKALIKRLKTQKTTVRSWVFFKKEVSVWEHLREAQGWNGPGFYAWRGGWITEEEGRLIDLASKWYDFESYTKFGLRVFLTPGDYRSLIWIAETKLCS